tara:strand:+ start:2184 stop:4076 length:1893 start_codon:yes stop_codon:yes gene_type:complete
MSYKINKTDSTLLVDLIDGRIDTDTTDLTLIGRNYTGYGEYFNENFIKLLENFSNTASPASPLRGQLWYDTSEGRLKVYDGSNWKGTDTTVVAGTQPSLLSGDIWIDSQNNQLYFSDGTDVVLAGPMYTASQGESGWDIVTLVDRFGLSKVVNRLMISGNCAAIVSKEDFIAATIDANLQYLNGFSTTINAGFNISTVYDNFEFHGPSASTRSLLDLSGDSWTPDDFIKSYPTLAAGVPQAINHYTHINADQGLLVGGDQDLLLKVETLGSNKVTIVRSRLAASDFKIQVNRSGTDTDALYIDNSTQRIGIWNNTPAYTLDVTGDLRVTGNLTVDGDTTYLDVTTLRVEDKNIELAVPSDSTLLDDAALDGAGITVKAAQGVDKEFVWRDTAEANGTWQVNTAFDIPSGYTYKINNATILSSTELASSVTTASGLTSIGTLAELNVDSINLNNKTISVNGLDMLFNESDITEGSFGSITFNNGDDIILKGVKTPNASDVGNYAATTEYVDERFANQNVYLSLDITNLNNAQIALVLNDLVPSLSKNEGVYAYVHCVSYAGTYSYNAGNGLTKSFVSVDKNGTENQSVLQDISFTTQSSQAVTLTVARSLKQFIRNGVGNWAFFQELTSSV